MSNWLRNSLIAAWCIGAGAAMGVVEYRITRLESELDGLERAISAAEEEGRALLSEEAKYSSIRRVREEAKSRGLILVPAKYVEIESIPVDPRFER
ncbi:MAG: hypothetical protein LBT92_01945 [Rickettsiales bacterium]|jgi:cell division protein FtsL|nr:hypothetical protein [Rickettsiales bacterium]